jgi:predicted TIM-barrel fold metal-dependent hydrolase
MVDQEERIPIIDADSHIAEPPDLWLSRVASKWGEKIPRVVWDETAGDYRWKVGDALLSAVGEYCTAGWNEPSPSHPATLEEADAATWQPEARLRALDAWGVHAQLLYPNLMTFDTHAFLNELGPQLATECVAAYNDYVAEFARVDENRFIPVMILPVWDVDASVKEMHRCRALGHKGALFSALLDRIGLPRVSEPVWEPLFAAAQELDLPLNCHVGFGVRPKETSVKGWSMRTSNALAQRTDRLSFVRRTSTSFFSRSVEAAAAVLLSRIPARFPNLRFVAVESGFGYWPYVLAQLDWFWNSSGAAEEYPERDLPSEVWRRCYSATFWFERDLSLATLEAFADNVMFETDFPHETSLQALGVNPQEHARQAVAGSGITTPVALKVLYENAARLYGLKVDP